VIRAVFGGVAVVCLLVGCGGSQHALRLPRDPYLGLACGNAALLRCGRVALAVWLSQPASKVTAVVDGHGVRLGTRPGGTGSYRRGLFWQGFFPDPGAQRLADASRSIPISVRVTMLDGSILAAKPTVYVSEGYG
jgi:hypothetical protein